MSEQRFSIELYHSMKPGQFSVLRRLEVRQTSDYKSSSVEVTLELARPELEHSEGRTLTLKFDGVRNLRLDQGTWSRMQFPLLEMGISEIVNGGYRTNGWTMNMASSAAFVEISSSIRIQREIDYVSASHPCREI